MLSFEVENRYQLWLSSPVFDEATKDELRNLPEDEIEDRFYCDLEFGTSGVRGVLGAGTNRMNIYLIRRLSYSLGNAMLEYAEDAAERGAVIAYDSRRFSADFALETALVLSAMGIKAYLFDALRPTPELSYAVRSLNAVAGVMITASHNPKEYNGYKVYWEDGAQVPPQQADRITRILRDCSWDVPQLTADEAIASGLVELIGEVVDDRYLECVKAEMMNHDMVKAFGRKMGIVYTPLHGAGKVHVEKVFRELGFGNMFTVPEQAEADTEFSTVSSPNPEDAGAWEHALRYAEARGAELLLATDPDADRMGVQCRLEDGSYYHFTGNQIGILLINYLLESGKAPADAVVVQNMVSTAFTKKLTDAYGVELRIVPVGFKFIGEQIKRMEKSGKGTFLFGFEESIGYLKGTYTRDKDAVLAAALVAEAALYYRTVQGKNLHQVLMGLYSRYGYFLDHQKSLKFEGKAGKHRIQEILAALAADQRPVLAGQKIVSRRKGGSLFSMEFENGGFIKARPSGTEPKIRFYFCIGANTLEKAQTTMEQIQEELLAII